MARRTRDAAEPDAAGTGGTVTGDGHIGGVDEPDRSSPSPDRGETPDGATAGATKSVLTGAVSTAAPDAAVGASTDATSAAMSGTAGGTIAGAARDATANADVPAPTASSLEAAAPTDEVLMRAWIGGDADAFDALYARHRGPLYRFVTNGVGDEALAQELFQDVWLRVVGARASWSPEAPFRAWLYRIARNRLIDGYRRRGHAAHESFDEESTSAVVEIAGPLRPDEIARLAERSDSLGEALLTLPPEQREAVLLKHVAGMSLAEIADVVGEGAETVKSRLRYGLVKLRRALRETIR